MSKSEQEILDALRKIVLDIEPSTSDDIKKVEGEINLLSRNAFCETTETMRIIEDAIELQE